MLDHGKGFQLFDNRRRRAATGCRNELYPSRDKIDGQLSPLTDMSFTRGHQAGLCPFDDVHRVSNRDRAYLRVRLYPQQPHLDHLTLFGLFETLNVNGDTAGDQTVSEKPAVDLKNSISLDCRWIEARTGGGVRHVYATLRLRVSCQHGRRCRETAGDREGAKYSHLINL